VLRPRIIPCLLVHQRGLVKTTRFAAPRYVGDPINAVRIFNEKQADELIVLDIDATVEHRPPDVRAVANLAAECRMPLCYGGGIRSAEQAKAIIAAGTEKVAISAAAAEDGRIVSELADAIGGQSVVVVFDVRRDARGTYSVWTHNARRDTGIVLDEAIARAQAAGAGEIVVNSIDADGTMGGYDLNLAARARAATALPLTILGGAGSLADIERLIATCGVVGAAAGSLFVFKGAFRAVLINYPSPVQKEEIILRAQASEQAGRTLV
jgi:cyclase